MSLTGEAQRGSNFRAHTIVRTVNPWPPHLNYRGEYRAVMQTPVSEKPSRTPELYLNTNDKNKQCSINIASHKSDLFLSRLSTLHIDLL